MVVVRQATRKDTPALARLFVEYQKEQGKTKIKKSTAIALVAHLFSTHKRFYVAEDDEVIGMIRFIAKYSVEKLGVKTSHDKRECGFISDGFVTKSKRRMGVLSLLLQRAESAAKEANVKYVYLTTFKSYMVSFCKKQGYTEVNSTVFLKQLK